MEKLSGLKVLQWKWSDACLDGIKWTENGRDLILSWTQLGINLRFECTWVAELDVQLFPQKNCGGMPMIWDYSFDELPNELISVKFDFGSKGTIAFICNDCFLSQY